MDPHILRAAGGPEEQVQSVCSSEGSQYSHADSESPQRQRDVNDVKQSCQNVRQRLRAIETLIRTTSCADSIVVELGKIRDDLRGIEEGEVAREEAIMESAKNALAGPALDFVNCMSEFFRTNTPP